ncbi:MAG: HYR domain-containing protein, partial [Bacteroidetes bacterium]|nr:HYR domain-containing protein [Bacteroidota bacterium]
MTTTELTITPGTLTPGEMYPFAVTANCGPSTTASSQGVINGTDIFDLPPEITISNINGSSCPGFADGSFDVTVDDECGGTYDITVDGTTQTAAAGSTVTFTGLEGSVGGTDYTVSLALNAAGGCNFDASCIADVSETATIGSTDVAPPTLEISDASSATPQVNQDLLAPEGECGVQRTWRIMAFDNCATLTTPLLTATITNNNLGVFPTAQLVQLNNAPTYALEIFAAIGTNTITITAEDESGNQTTETFTITVEDQRVPEIYTPEDMVVEVPSCEEDIPVNWTVSVVDDCDVQPTLEQVAGPDPGEQLTPGTYTVTYEAEDDFGNTATESFTIEVVQAASPAPIVDISGNGQFNVPSCEDDALVVFSGNVYDCDLTPFNFNPADLTVNTVPLSPGASGSVAISFTNPQEGFVYFEATGDLTPGSYLIVVDYQGVTVDHAVLVEQDADQPAEIDMPGNLSFLAPVCEPGADVSFSVQVNDDCDTDLSGATVELDGSSDDIVYGTNGVYFFNGSLPAGMYTLTASYTDGAGNTTDAEVTLTVAAQPDNWAPIVIYPSQQINEEIDECSPATAANVFFEVSATDNCGAVTGGGDDAAPQSNGFEGDYAPANWTLENFEDDDPAELLEVTPTTLRIESAADDGGFASIAMAEAGTLSFDYEYLQEAVFVDDIIIIDVDGTILLQVDFDNDQDNAGSGSISEDVPPG